MFGTIRHALEAEVLGGGTAVELGTGDVAFLDAHRAQRLGAVNADVHFLAGFEQVEPCLFTVVGRNVDFVGEFTRERNAEQACRNII